MSSGTRMSESDNWILEIEEVLGHLLEVEGPMSHTLANQRIDTWVKGHLVIFKDDTDKNQGTMMDTKEVLLEIMRHGGTMGMVLTVSLLITNTLIPSSRMKEEITEGKIMKHRI